MKLQRGPGIDFLIKTLPKTLPFLIILAVSLIVLRDVLFTPGLVSWGNFVAPLSVEKYLTHFYPLWNPYGNFPVFSDMTLWIMGPAIKIASALHISAEWFFKLLMLGTTLLAGLSMYYMARILIKEVNRNEKVVFIASITAALVYMLNPWVMSNMSHLVFLMSYALAPLVLVCFMKALQSRKLTYIIATALLWSLATLTPQFPLFIAILILSWLVFTLFCQFKAGVKSTVFSDIKVTALIAVFYLAFNAFWILPHLSSGFISPGYVLRYEDLDHLSRNGSLLNTIRFMGFWEPSSMTFYQPSSSMLYYPWVIGGFLVPLFAFTSLLLKPKGGQAFKYVLYFSLMSILLIFLAGGTKSPFPSAYNWMIFDIPFFSDKFGWLFREPNKIAGLLALMFSFLIAFTISGLFQRDWKIRNSINRVSIPIGITVVFLPLFSVFIAPATNHYLGDYLVPHTIPQEFYEINQWSKEESGDFKLWWLPQHIGDTTWGYSHPAYAFYYWVADKPSLGGEGSFTASGEYYYDYIYYESLLNNKTANFSKYLNPLNIRYVLLHNDVIGYEQEADTVINNLHESDLVFDRAQGFISIFENQSHAPHLFIPSQNLLVCGGFDIMDSLYSIEATDFDSIGLLYVDQVRHNSYPSADGIVLGMRNNINDIALSQVDEQYLIAPVDYTNHWNPVEVWSKSDLINWHWFVRGQGFTPEPYDFDYGKGLVSTFDFAGDVGDVPPHFVRMGNVVAWQTLHNTGNEDINLSSEGESLVIDYTFHNEDALSVYARTAFEEENWAAYDTITLRVYGDGSGDTISLWYQSIRPDNTRTWVGTGSWTMDWTGWQELSFTMYPEQNRTSVNGLQIAVSWDINKSQAGLGSHQIKVKDIVWSSSGVQPPRHTLVIPVEIEESGRYRLYARVLENPSGGELSVLIEGQEIASVNTEGRESNLVWKDLGVGILNKGTVHLTLENSLGFNAVNVLALIPEDVAEGYFDSARQFLEGVRTIQVWEGKLATPRIIETGEVAGQVSPRSIATGGIEAWQTTHNTESEDINISSAGQSLVVDYTFINEDSLSVYAQTSFGVQNWTDYDTLSLSVYGDGSGNSLNFWYQQLNPDDSGAWHGIGFCTLSWTGWKKLSFNLPQFPRDRVDHFMIALSWDLNKSQAGLGSHQIKVEDVKIAASQWDAGGGLGPGHIDRLGSEDGALVIDYTFEDENSLSVYALTEFEPEDWTYRDTLSVSVYGDGSGNYLDFWCQQLNDDGSTSWYGMGSCTLHWTGWRELSFSVADWPKDNVKGFTVSVAWDVNKSQAGLGSHQIKVKDVVISIGPPEAATTSIDILKHSDYQIGVLAPMGPGCEPITLRVDSQELEIDLTSDEEGLNWAYSEPIFLYAGQHTLQVYQGMAVIDRLMIFSTSSEETLEDIFQAGNSPATVTSWEEIGATKYVAHVDAQSPFMLAFAESYNTQWVARVNGKEYKSQPLYAVINGFLIEETGELKIIIEYKPQRWFDYGAIISMVSLLGAFAFVVWDWRLKRNQRMRSKFRRWFSYGAAALVAIMRGALALVARYWRRSKGEGM